MKSIDVINVIMLSYDSFFCLNLIITFLILFIGKLFKNICVQYNCQEIFKKIKSIEEIMSIEC